ncbi:unnamed protein product, partial [Urochloa humidicola]
PLFFHTEHILVELKEEKGGEGEEGEKRRRGGRRGEEEHLPPAPRCRPESRCRPLCHLHQVVTTRSFFHDDQEEELTPPTTRSSTPSDRRRHPLLRLCQAVAVELGGGEHLDVPEHHDDHELEPDLPAPSRDGLTSPRLHLALRRALGSSEDPEDPDYFDDVDYAKEVDKDNTPVCELQVRTWSTSPNV